MGYTQDVGIATPGAPPPEEPEMPPIPMPPEPWVKPWPYPPFYGDILDTDFFKRIGEEYTFFWAHAGYEIGLLDGMSPQQAFDRQTDRWNTLIATYGGAMARMAMWDRDCRAFKYSGEEIPPPPPKTQCPYSAAGIIFESELSIAMMAGVKGR
jgi:hypothetical protein